MRTVFPFIKKGCSVIQCVWLPQGFPGDSVGKESVCNTGDPSSIPGWEDPPEKEMETHSSILAWRIPWTEEIGGLYSPWGRK